MILRNFLTDILWLAPVMASLLIFVIALALPACGLFGTALLFTLMSSIIIYPETLVFLNRNTRQ